MRIIKLGTRPTDRLHTLTCGSCGTVFEFKQSEGRLTTDRNESVLLVDCPICKRTMGVNPYKSTRPISSINPETITC